MMSMLQRAAPAAFAALAALSSLAAAGQSALPDGAGEPVETFRDALSGGGAGPEMVVIPPGSFRMGCLVDGGPCYSDELPVHAVTINYRFALSKHEVTFAHWDACVADGGCGGYSPDDEGWGRGERPVMRVSWEHAQSYAAWLSEQTGETYRLPTEAEWEYAARAGTQTQYYWGNETGSNRANCAGCGSDWDADRTAPAGSFPANAWGLHDMHGNVWEWVEDCWHVGYGGAPTDGSAWLSGVSGECPGRVLRSGSWNVDPELLHASFRGWDTADYLQYHVGFRVARRVPHAPAP